MRTYYSEQNCALGDFFPQDLDEIHSQGDCIYVYK
jgi:hypothetical protein